MEMKYAYALLAQAALQNHLPPRSTDSAFTANVPHVAQDTISAAGSAPLCPARGAFPDEPANTHLRRAQRR